MHGDLKPATIGIRGAQVTLLDMEGSVQFPFNKKLSPNPGRGGTVKYLAPERELQKFDWMVDMWSMGIVLFELIYGCHPWPFEDNPWRPGNEGLRSEFCSYYTEAIQKIQSSAETSPGKFLSRIRKL